VRLPFSVDQFLGVFRRYNEAVWPAQWGLVLLAAVALAMAVRGRPGRGRVVSAILAFLWLWMALVYHLAFFARVNGAAVAFAAAFVVQGLLFAWVAWRGVDPSYRPPSPAARGVGAAIIAYGLVVYPVLGYFLGHRYPAAPTFGVPCPTTIVTLGLLVWSSGRTPWWLLVIPLAWALIGTSAAVNLGMVEDGGLLASGLLAAASTLGSRRIPWRLTPLNSDRRNPSGVTPARRYADRADVVRSAQKTTTTRRASAARQPVGRRASP